MVFIVTSAYNADGLLAGLFTISTYPQIVRVKKAFAQVRPNEMDNFWLLRLKALQKSSYDEVFEFDTGPIVQYEKVETITIDGNFTMTETAFFGPREKTRIPMA